MADFYRRVADIYYKTHLCCEEKQPGSRRVGGMKPEAATSVPRPSGERERFEQT